MPFVPYAKSSVLYVTSSICHLYYMLFVLWHLKYKIRTLMLPVPYMSLFICTIYDIYQAILGCLFYMSAGLLISV